ncbi:hypothetical protein [Methylorubrum aminovorans]
MALAFGCGESTGSSFVVGVRLSSGAGIAGSGDLFGSGRPDTPFAEAGLAMSERFTIYRFVIPAPDGA